MCLLTAFYLKHESAYLKTRLSYLRNHSRIDISSISLKDVQQQMEFPFFSLSKKPDLELRRYEDRQGNTPEIIAHFISGQPFSGTAGFVPKRTPEPPTSCLVWQADYTGSVT